MGGCGRVGAVVNPALAGMIRIAVAVRRVGAGKPRASGDDPRWSEPRVRVMA